MTNENGEYEISSLPPGTYKIRYEASGFLTYEVKKLTIDKNNAFKVDVTLKPGQVTFTVGIIGGGPFIDTSSSSPVSIIVMD